MTLFARRTNLREASGYSVVDEQMVMRGEISTEGTIRVDGRVEGRVHRADTLILGTNGVLMGDVESREVIIAGTVEGNIVAGGRVELKASATVRGDVRSSAMTLHEGATLNGHVIIARHEVAPVEGRRLELKTAERPAVVPR
jgi:cytoskeletal protein CcmA (bactofilin family)